MQKLIVRPFVEPDIGIRLSQLQLPFFGRRVVDVSIGPLPSFQIMY
ncbi:MAG: hypothetical protein LBJ65_20945 [Burkholderia sp.]|jgi:hypothetical protein|nr:hypothetical protein [Burkholderia sp.]MDR0244071.1 hypothetical protein [Burkholderia sp.]